MTLQISKNSTLTDVLSTGDGTNPITTQHPITGGSQEQRLWLFNNGLSSRFENVSIVPTDNIGDSSNRVQLAPDNDGNPGEYLEGGGTLKMDDISDVDVGKVFWMKVTTPAVENPQNTTDIKLTVNFQRFMV